MAIEIVDRAGTFRLITDGDGHYAIVEARAGRVYSVHGHDRREADDDPDGMAQVVGDDGWAEEDKARRTFDQVARGGDTYARIIW